jgi:hypothetical protein
MSATIELPSTIQGVTVHRRDALVRRVADVGDLAVPTVAKIGPLPLTIHPSSVRAVVLDASGALAGPAATARLAVEPVGLAGAGRATPAADAVEQAQRSVDEARNEVERLGADIAALTTRLEPTPRPRATSGDEALVRRDRETVEVARRLAVLSLRSRQLDLLTPALVSAQRVLRDATRAYEEALDRWRAASMAEGREHELVAVAFVALQGAGRTGPGARLELSYLAAGATWRPSHRLFLDGATSSLGLGAVVTQRTGEDWAGVTLDLATTEPSRHWQLPDLKPLRIGRAAPPAAVGWRPPEPLPAELFADFDRAVRVAQDDHRLDLAPAAGGAADAAPPWLEHAGLAPDAMTADAMTTAAMVAAGAEPPVPVAPPAAPPPPQQSMPAPAPAMAPQMLTASARSAPKGGLRRSRQGASAAAPPPPRGGGAGDTFAAPMMALPRDPDPDRPDESVADLDLLVLPAPTGGDRGRPRPHAPTLAAAHQQTAEARGHVVDELAADGFSPYDRFAPGQARLACVYRVNATVDIPSARTSSTIVIAEAPTGVREEHVTVPYAASDVFRTLVFTNPFEVPVVAGPLEVSGRAGYIGPAELPTITPGAEARVGIGVEDGISVERQVDHRDDAKGLVRSSRVLEHDVTIRLTNRLGTAATVIVRERVPTVPETEERATVEELAIEPPWQRYERPDAILRGGRQWSVTIEPAQVATLRARWQIVIPAKFELEGGNRR